MRKLYEKLKKREDGSALVLVAGSLVVLMGLAAFGVDLAWFYLNSSRVQRGADAAALAGVIHLPQQPGTAGTTALNVATQNGYDDTVAGTTVTPVQIAANELEVTISQEVATFFLKVFGWDTQTITERAIAEYIPPLKLGSPVNEFGNSCDPELSSGCGDNFWANIHGWFTNTSMGDAFGSHCQGGSDDDEGCTANAVARDSGYLYGIESTSGFTLQFIDIAFHNTSGGVTTSDQHRTGDRGCEDWGPSTAADCGPTMIVNLFAPDSTPQVLSDNGAPACTAVIPPQPQVAETEPYNWQAPDGQGCWSQAGAGIWVVQVVQQYPGSTNDRSGLNRYSIRSTTGQLFALRDFSIYNNSDGSTTSFFLAEVPDFYAGKTLVIEMFDPGEFSGAGTGFLQPFGPDGTQWNDGECRTYTRSNPSAPWSSISTIPAGSGCQISTTSGQYNNRWVKFEMDIPPTYDCDETTVPSSCWWKMNYVYPGSAPVQDTTTWAAYIIGNPIHLIG